MQEKSLGQKFIVRLDPQDEIISSLKQFCQENKIKVGVITGIGSVSKVSLKFFRKETKEFVEKTFEEEFEVTSLLGNVTTMGGETYIHVHITLSDQEFKCFGGHLSEGYVGATCEIIIDQVDGEVERELSDEIGLNIFKLS